MSLLGLHCPDQVCAAVTSCRDGGLHWGGLLRGLLRGLPLRQELAELPALGLHGAEQQVLHRTRPQFEGYAARHNRQPGI